MPLEALEGRIRDFSTRGILMREGQNLADIFDERSPLYEKYASAIVDTSDDGVFENCLRIERVIDSIRK